MIRMAIVEDEAQYASQLREYVDRYSRQSGKVFEVTGYTDGDELVENFHAQFDIILMDVEMPFLDGMTAAEMIRKTDPQVVIIFITNMAQYAIRGYAVDAMDYVLKPVSYFAFSQRLERAVERMERRVAHYITIPVPGGAQKLAVSRIYYIESYGHKLIYHTADGDFTSAGTMGELEAQMEQYHFCRGNKGYLMNLAHVDGIRDGCALIQGEMLPLSRARKKAFLEALTDYVGEAMK